MMESSPDDSQASINPFELINTEPLDDDQVRLTGSDGRTFRIGRLSFDENMRSQPIDGGTGSGKNYFTPLIGDGSGIIIVDGEKNISYNGWPGELTDGD